MEGNVYFFSGLGVDCRTFDGLELSFRENVKYVDWIPGKQGENLNTYAARLVEHYAITSDDSLVGVSFGGMIATEIHSHLNTKKTILISSAASQKDVHGFLRMTTWLRLNKLIPKRKLNKPNPFLHHGFGVETNAEKQQLNEIIATTDVDFAYWAIGEIGRWKRKDRPEGVIKIHGSHDRIIPINNLENDYTILNGTHFMAMNRSKEISTLLNQLIPK